MDIHPVAEGFHQVLVLAEVRHDAEFDLRVVGRYDHPFRRPRNEGLADFLAALGADGDVLKVRVGAREPAGGRKRLVERRMDTAVHLRYIGRERLDVGGQQFLDGPELQDLVHDRMPVRDGEEGGFVGGILAAGALFRLRVQSEFVEEDVTHLLGGGNVQSRLVHQFTDVGLPFRHFAAESLRETVQLLQVHLHAGALHLGEDLCQRFFHVVIEPGAVAEFFPDLLSQQGKDGRLADAGVPAFLGNLVKERARADLGRRLFQFHVQVTPGQDVHGVTLLRVHQVVHQGDVVPFPLKCDARVVQQVRLQFEVVAVFVDAAVFQDVPDAVDPVAGNGAGLLPTAEDEPLDGGEDPVAVTLRDEAAVASRTDGLYDLIDRNLIDNEFLPLLGGRGRADMGDEPLEGVELVFFEKVRDGGGEVHVQAHVLRRRFQRDVGLDRDQFLGEPDMVPGLFELRLLAGGEFAEMGIDVLDAAVLGHQFPGTHFTHALHAGDIVRRIAADGQHVDDLDRVQDAPFLADGTAADDLVIPAGLPGLVLENVLGDELAVVLVGRDHIHVHPFPGAAEGH